MIVIVCSLTVMACLFFIVYKLMHCLFCLLVGVGSRPSSCVQLTGAGAFFSLHCSGWSLKDLFGRTVTTKCHLADQSNVWVYQEVSWNVRTAVACIRV